MRGRLYEDRTPPPTEEELALRMLLRRAGRAPSPRQAAAAATPPSEGSRIGDYEPRLTGGLPRRRRIETPWRHGRREAQGKGRADQPPLSGSTDNASLPSPRAATGSSGSSARPGDTRGARNVCRPLHRRRPVVGEEADGAFRAPRRDGVAALQPRDGFAASRRVAGTTVEMLRPVLSANRPQSATSRRTVSSMARKHATNGTCVQVIPCIVSVVTRYGIDYLRQAVRQRIDAEGLRPFSHRTGIPLGQLRSVIEGRAARSTTLELIASVLELEFYIGPARADSTTRPRLPSEIARKPSICRATPRSTTLSTRSRKDAMASRLREGIGLVQELMERAATAAALIPRLVSGGRSRAGEASESGVVMIPFAPEVRLAAGTGEVVFEESPEVSIAVAADALASWARPERLTCVRAAGDSMEPQHPRRRPRRGRPGPDRPAGRTVVRGSDGQRSRHQAPAAEPRALAAGQRQPYPCIASGGRERPDSRAGRVVRPAGPRRRLKKSCPATDRRRVQHAGCLREPDPTGSIPDIVSGVTRSIGIELSLRQRRAPAGRGRGSGEHAVLIAHQAFPSDS